MGEAVDLRVLPSADDVAREAAGVVAGVVAAKPNAVLALPTGTTPLGMFKDLVRRIRSGEADFSRATFFCLDEYLGVSREDPNSLTGWLFREFFDPAGIEPGQVETVPSEPADPIAAAAAYEARLAAAGGLDLVVLGIGENGHIAFNEPGSTRDSRTRLLDLTPESQAQAAAYWAGSFPAPTQAMTIGVATILDARQILLIATGAAKSPVLERALRGPITDDVPASHLRSAPEKVTVLIDKAASGED